jgi:hypothetical protein
MLIKGLGDLSKRCKAIFNKDVVDNWIKNVAPKMHYVDQANNDQIPGYPGGMTYNQYWQRNGGNSQGIGALAVAVTDPLTGGLNRILSEIITGAGYANPALYDSGTFWLFGGSNEKAQAGYLIHEFLHFAYQKNDVGLAAELGLKARGYGDVNDRNSASVAITTFLANKCEDKK